MEVERFIYVIGSNELNVSIGGKSFDMQVYDCVQKKFFKVLSIKCEGRTVKVSLDELCEDILIHG